MIERFSVQGYRCLEDVSLALTPLHALIGPNDSGKSTILEAIRSLCFRCTNRDELPPVTGSLRTSQGTFQWIGQRWELPSVTSHIDGLRLEGTGYGQFTLAAHQGPLAPDHWPVRSLRLNGAALRAPASAISVGQTLDFQKADGTGLASVLSAVRDRDLEFVLAQRERLRTLFPSLKDYRILTQGEHRSLAGVLHDGTEVPADKLSEGILYWLAYDTLAALDKAAVLLIEEPENGLHPARIAEVMRVLRAIVAGGTQVILATHSPLVINELKPEEVTLVTRPNGGPTKVTPMTQTANFEERSKVYALGELWLSYADGEAEERLVGSAP